MPAAVLVLSIGFWNLPRAPPSRGTGPPARPRIRRQVALVNYNGSVALTAGLIVLGLLVLWALIVRRSA